MSEWTTTVGSGYVILPSGDILTADGKPCSVDDMQLRLVRDKARRPLAFKFRAPTEAEQAMFRRATAVPQRLLGAFREIDA